MAWKFGVPGETGGKVHFVKVHSSARVACRQMHDCRRGPAVRQTDNRDRRSLGRRGMEGTTVAAKGMIRLMGDRVAGRKIGKSRRWLPNLEPEQWETVF